MSYLSIKKQLYGFLLTNFERWYWTLAGLCLSRCL